MLPPTYGAETANQHSHLSLTYFLGLLPGLDDHGLALASGDHTHYLFS